MRKIIKQILKEEIETNIKDFKKGMNAIMSILKKEFPFIVGYELAAPINQYKYSFYITLILDANKVQKYYNAPFKDMYNTEHGREYFLTKKHRENFAYPFSILEIHENEDFDFYQEYLKIKEYMIDMYELIPDEYKPINENTLNPKNIDIDGFSYVV